MEEENEYYYPPGATEPVLRPKPSAPRPEPVEAEKKADKESVETRGKKPHKSK